MLRRHPRLYLQYVRLLQQKNMLRWTANPAETVGLFHFVKLRKSEVSDHNRCSPKRRSLSETECGLVDDRRGYQCHRNRVESWSDQVHICVEFFLSVADEDNLFHRLIVPE